jgi:diguanylate cyclase (GGDEF)-like protein
MSMIRQVWMLILGIILLACIGSVAVSVTSARDYLQSQLALKNNDNAQALALTLSQQRGDQKMMELALSAQFDTGYYRSIRLHGADGAVLVERVAQAQRADAPSWFVERVPIVSAPGVAQVTNGWNVLGTLEVVSHPSFVYASLWASTVRMAQWMLVLGLLAGLVGWLAVRQLRRPLDAVVEQAYALTQRRFVAIAEPAVPELKRVAQALNAMVARVRTMYAEQMDQVEQLSRLANCDSLTGVAHRRHFMSRMEDELRRETGNGRGLLVLMRVGELGQANRQLGHALTDGLLRQAARALEAGTAQEQPLLAGRLNGTDFAALYAHPADAERVLSTLLSQVQEAFAPFEQSLVVASCVSWHRGEAVATAMQAADAALARAELRGDGAFELVGSVAPASRAQGGEESWRRRLTEALADDRLSLAEYPLLDRAGRVIHQECPLRIRIEAEGAAEPASAWLALAVRTGLIARIDLAAVALALDMVERDGVPRGINIAPAALLDASFLPLLRGLVSEHPEAAARLSLEIDESVLAGQHTGLVTLCQELRPLGVRVGLEHAGERSAQSSALLTVGIDFVKLRASFVAGVAAHDTQAILVRGTAVALHGLDIKVYAQGVADPRDLNTLWSLGLDGATGPAVREPRSH